VAQGFVEDVTAAPPPGAVERTRAPRSATALVVAMTLLALVLRLPSFADSLFGDELSTYYIVTGHGLGRTLDLLAGNTADLNPPLTFVLAWLTERLGDPAQSLRVASLVAGVAAVPLTYVLGLWTIGRGAGLVAAALLALSPLLIFYSTEARAYSVVLCLVLLSTLALVRAVRTDGLRWWVAYGVTSCAAIYAHYPAAFVLIAQIGWALWARPGAWRALLAANGAAAVAYLPWVPTLLDNTRSPGAKVIALLDPFNAHDVRVDLGRWAFGHPYIPIAIVPGHIGLALLAAGVALGAVATAVALGRAVRAGAPPRPSEGVVLVVALALAAPVLIALYSSIGDSVWNTRNLIVSWPGLAVAVGALVTAGAGVARIAAVALVVAGFAVAGVRMLDAGNQRPDYADAARFIEATGGPRAPVVELPAPSPGPLTPVGDVHLNRFGQADAGRHVVLRLGAAPLAVALRARPYAPTRAPTPRAIAAQAADLARGRALFLVVPGAARPAALRGTEPLTVAGLGLENAFGDGPPATLMNAALAPVRPFVAALEDTMRLDSARTFSGFMPVSVYVFRER
jgi:mannosyltransferase